MGGKVALTIRTSEVEQWRGSCHTNLLPYGLFAPEFYVDPDTSRRHVRSWLELLLSNRRECPELERMWGLHGMCAPVDYGIVVIDYVSHSFVSAQGYSYPHLICLFEFEEAGSGKLDKWRALEAAGLLLNVRKEPDLGFRLTEADIRMPFEHVQSAEEGLIDPAMVDWADRTLGLSDKERAAWGRWIDDHGPHPLEDEDDATPDPQTAPTKENR